MLTFVRDAYWRGDNIYATFRCDCGNEVTLRKFGHRFSCGCVSLKATHGKSKTRVYRIWTCMKERCYYTAHMNYDKYGGRGITVCQRWLESFENFYTDMGEPPTNKHSLDRIDNEKGYSKENCRWSTQKEQQRNTSRNRRLTYEGKTLTMVEWAELLGIRAGTISERLRKGFRMEIVLSSKLYKKGDVCR